ncbi:magnesium/cobalt transporter CorA [Metabacillus idriensis]|uniref:magnesium/cobalt transporter CorA n=1 Tax=Metabacillus idriensis TaxID=324768 RepID=UPI002813988D|nr:magnesium/cobalt transporter CorA [Metabacillus idriensis]MDR0137060.1 magnesium/cobalt transporter CorA [Metabacillus idriensis]
MIRTLAVQSTGAVTYDLPLKELKNPDIKWYWVDFQDPTAEEIKLLSKFFKFHPLTIEDCVEFVQRPKIDTYDTYLFVVMHSIHQKTLEAEELDLFVAKNYAVTFHKKSIRDLNNIWFKLKKDNLLQEGGPSLLMHQLMDQLVDEYFPPVYQLEDQLNEIEENTKDLTISELMEGVFDIRTDLYKLRRTIIPMRDLLYRMISSNGLKAYIKDEIYFQDIYDHLLKLVEMIDANRELSADIRDSYLSISSDRMNRVMMTLTVISSIFLPLTFIAGLYGMNFQYMPELTGKYNYFIVVAIMVFIAAGMIYFFAKMGWFRYHKGTKL